jgi:hypothetical protein
VRTDLSGGANAMMGDRRIERVFLWTEKMGSKAELLDLYGCFAG